MAGAELCGVKYPMKVYTQGEVIKVVRRKPSGSGRASWHPQKREVHCSGAEAPSGEAAIKTYFNMVIEAGADLALLDLKQSDITTLAAVVTDGFMALMEAQD